MVYAIISFMCSLISLFIFWWLCIPGVIFGIIALSTLKEDSENTTMTKTFALLGLIIGVLATIMMMTGLALM